MRKRKKIKHRRAIVNKQMQQKSYKRDGQWSPVVIKLKLKAAAEIVIVKVKKSIFSQRLPLELNDIQTQKKRIVLTQQFGSERHQKFQIFLATWGQLIAASTGLTSAGNNLLSF